MTYYFFIALLIIIGPIILNVIMLFSINKYSDERAAHIKATATQRTFLFRNGYICYHVIRMFIESWRADVTVPYTGLNPIIILAVISIFYFLALAYYKLQFGG